MPIIFHVGTSSADMLTDNTLTLYRQTAKRLCLSDEEVTALCQLNEDRALEDLLSKLSERIGSQDIRTHLFEAAIITAAASQLEYVEAHHQCLLQLSSVMQVEYCKHDLTNRIKAFKG